MNFTDHLGRIVVLESLPKRIVSIVPSQTELLYDLGLEDEVIGITKFCVHPESWFRSKKRVGGTKQLNFDAIRELKPDLIIANKEENNREDIEQLSAHFPVWVSDVKDLNGALQLIADVGEITGKIPQANELQTTIREGFDRLEKELESEESLSAVYLIWSNPDMVAGSDTFISDMLSRAGFENVISERRYPELGSCEYKTPDYILLSSEPFPFKEKHVKFYQERFPGSEILIVDGEMFSWYGSRLLKVPDYFSELLQKCRAV